ncbi:hypothetical protein L596_010028 [Steinernema carpocapsae]|uniref:Uncharacterized protein n=1 Tax=Steinernema carpocapsae TaxID=34508 RepID=A0A4U5PH45_STECR|nr:hypothetical protein L596_010028 [Steinernema carpocapsae]
MEKMEETWVVWLIHVWNSAVYTGFHGVLTHFLDVLIHSPAEASHSASFQTADRSILAALRATTSLSRLPVARAAPLPDLQTSLFASLREVPPRSHCASESPIDPQTAIRPTD